MRSLSIGLALLFLMCGCQADKDVFAVSSEKLFQQAEDGWKQAGYELVLKAESSPISLSAPQRYYDTGNGDTLAIYIFSSVQEANAAKKELEKPSTEWDFLIPVYMVKRNVLFVYFTPVNKARPPLFEKLEKVVSNLNLDA
ncbi:hypothetical protein [Ectobacillus panaciterrae]|uniref:hypothetical protein n=1 Tax=Ectobacillus panaciterrae TaxID=363872 RepID=UPI0003FAE580|nr:hypothetical protein [Ectobacillus panaciterrae]